MSNMHIYIRMKVVLIKKYLNINLLNSSTGIVKELFYSTNNPVPVLPILLFIDFNIE